MRNHQEFLDNFFKDLIPHDELSVCCSAPPLGDVFLGYGRCKQCLEMSEFKGEEDDN